MLPSFKFNLEHDILPRMVTIGKYDGLHPCLTCGTSAGKVLIHNPHETSNPEIRFLNINRKLTALHAGQFSSQVANNGDILLVGTQSNLLAYDVNQNSDIFYKDIPDGVNALHLGKLPTSTEPLAIVGGNCSVQGFDTTGSESFWTVAGDNVTCLTLADVTSDGSKELVVGSDDYEIRGLHDADVLLEITETGPIIDLCPISKGVFAYALKNGTVGVYRGKHRVWRVKSKHVPVSIVTYDIDGDGEPEVIIGWDSGKVEARRHENGSVVFKTTFTSSVAAVLVSDYKCDGTPSLVCASINGEVCGYKGGNLTSDVTSSTTTNAIAIDNEEKVVRSLAAEKQRLSSELKNMEKNVRQMKLDPSVTGDIHSTTCVSITAVPNVKNSVIDLVFVTNNDSVIKAIVLFDFDAGIFKNGAAESFVHIPDTPLSKVSVPILPSKKGGQHTEVDLKVQILVGQRRSASHFHVFEKKCFLPKFATFASIEEYKPSSVEGKVSFAKPERYQKLDAWVRDTFIVDDTNTSDNTEAFTYVFKSLTDSSTLVIELTSTSVEIITPHMALAADVVQDMCNYLEVEELESTANFPAITQDFKETIVKVDEFNSTRGKLTAEMADNSSHVKALVIRAEDSRLLNDMNSMKKMYAELYTLNNQLIGEYVKRSTNHEALLTALKEVNNMIQLASKLRMGRAKARVIKACRAAIKSNNIHALFYIIQTGEEEAAP